ncbi:MAG TPA: right-handed parallel beta-helix repeat-containing protein [Verrucomicrobiae bacterium]|jgi:hypothetical protein|nr:right-handed parallel beta-helix repeat-containing protein [Verrucomicrobiae bacterium]
MQARYLLNKLLVATLAALCFTAHVFPQGTLTPPGPPVPTMKSLQQIEPRTPISSLPFTITDPGSYYVTGNLTGVSNFDGIDIQTPYVDLDLRGFTLTGANGSGHGIAVPSGPVDGISIHDGNLVNWPLYGVMGTNANASRLERLRASGNTEGGLAIGANSLVEGCFGSGSPGIPIGVGIFTSGGFGILAGDGCRMLDCTATANGIKGIVAGKNCTISGCAALQNATGAGAGGISTGSGCTITGCTANNNNNLAGTGFGMSVGSYSTVKNCTATGNGTGIGAANGCNIIECTACQNLVGSGYGIAVGSFCLVRGCLAVGNDYNGIVVNGSNSAIQENASTWTYFGNDILINGSYNSVIRNIVGTNFPNANVPGIGVPGGSNNIIGTLDSSTTANTNKNPHANFQP